VTSIAQEQSNLVSCCSRSTSKDCLSNPVEGSPRPPQAVSHIAANNVIAVVNLDLMDCLLLDYEP